MPLTASGTRVEGRSDPAAWSRLLTAAMGLLLFWPLVAITEFHPLSLLDARSLEVTGRFLGTFFPPQLDAVFLHLVAVETWRTVAMATAGVFLALVIATPLALLATRVLSVSLLSGRMSRTSALLRHGVRWILLVLRSVPELIWALVFVRVVGLGATAGVFAIALTYTGMLGKVFTEVLESSDVEPTRALLRNGSGRLQAFVYALLPQNAAELSSYTVYRWECAIRSSVVLGFVGAGGLGQQLDSSMKMFNGGEVSTMLLVFVALVALADVLSGWLRRVLA